MRQDLETRFQRPPRKGPTRSASYSQRLQQLIGCGRISRRTRAIQGPRTNNRTNIRQVNPSASEIVFDFRFFD